VSVDVTDQSARLTRRSREAGRMATAAAASHLVREVKKAFGSDYYKGGAFRSTLQVKQSIVSDGPRETATGWEATVGTRLVEALYWELGHHNTFTRRYERVELWRPTAVAETDAMRATYARVFARYLAAGA
jgi:hypothetical protein